VNPARRIPIFDRKTLEKREAVEVTGVGPLVWILPATAAFEPRLQQARKTTDKTGAERNRSERETDLT
jgi:hypothetical protein